MHVFRSFDASYHRSGRLALFKVSVATFLKVFRPFNFPLSYKIAYMLKDSIV